MMLPTKTEDPEPSIPPQDEEVTSATTSTHSRSRLVAWRERVASWPSRDPYTRWEKRAQYLKARAQMVIGFVLVVALACRAIAPPVHWLTLSESIGEFSKIPPLEIVSWGLMYAAGVELAYMLFTPGPDEAIGPVILGLASTILLVVSDGSDDWKDAIIVPVLTASLGLLFYVNERYERSSRNS